MNRIRRQDVGLGEELGEEFGELLDLAELVRHAFAGQAAVVGHAECAQPWCVSGDEVRFGAVVSFGRRSGGDGGGFNGEAHRAVWACLQLGGLDRGEEVGVEEVTADERFDQGERLGGRVVFGDVARSVAPEERELRAGFERDWADEEVLKSGVGSAVFPEGELHERAVVDGGVQQGEEAGTGVGRGHEQIF